MRCKYNQCNSDSRYRHKEYMMGVEFVIFPKPHENLARCKAWVDSCSRDGFTVNNVTNDSYVCTKHFIGGKGPTREHPNPIAFSHASKSNKEKKNATDNDERMTKDKKNISDSERINKQKKNSFDTADVVNNLLTMASVESRYFNSNYGNDDMEFEEEQQEEEEDEREESDEDTEEASETENRRSEENKDSKDSIYHEKLNLFKTHLQQLNNGTYYDFLRRLKPLEQKYRERLRLNEVWRKHQIELMEKDFIVEKCAASKELEEKKIELKDSLFQEMEEKRRVIESERTSMELSGDCTESKPAVTRKLRRRPNDPVPLPEKRRGKMASLPSQINFLLDEKDIEADLKAMQRSSKTNLGIRKTGPLPSNGVQPVIPTTSSDKFDNSQGDTRIEDGKLLFERRWFHRGQPVYVEGRDLPKFPAIISAIGSEAVMVKKTVDASKIKISLNQLIRGKVSIKRRAS